MNTTILQLVAIYNIQLHVSALYVGHHQVVQKNLLTIQYTRKFWKEDDFSSYVINRGFVV